MMSKWHKKIAVPFIFVFALPILTFFCCCGRAVAAEKTSHAHQHAAAEDPHHANHSPSDDSDSACHHSSKSSHDHSECNHPQIIADLAGKVVSFLASQDSGFKIAEKDFALSETVTSVSKVDSSPPSGTGPPGGLFSGTPLYLQLSVLRI
jgi:hypothetical protein